MRVGDGNVRIFYFFLMEKRIVLLHAFKKKTQELPELEIERAQRTMTDFLERYERGELVF